MWPTKLTVFIDSDEPKSSRSCSPSSTPRSRWSPHAGSPKSPKPIAPREVIPDKQIRYKEDTIFVGGLPHDSHRDNLMDRFREFGEIKKIIWPLVWDSKLGRKRPKGFAYVIFADKESVQAVLKAHEAGIYLPEFPRSRLGIDRKRDNTNLTAQVRARRVEMGLPAHDDKDKQHETETYVGADGGTYIKSMLFIGNVPTEASRDDIEKMFSAYGHVKKIVWPQAVDPVSGSRKHKGFCYVIYFSHADSLKVLAAAKPLGDQLEIHGTMLAVQPKLATSGSEGSAGSLSRTNTVITRGPGTDFEALYKAEKAKNERLQKVIREQRTQMGRKGMMSNSSSLSASPISGRWNAWSSPSRSTSRSPRTPTGSSPSPRTRFQRTVSLRRSVRKIVDLRKNVVDLRGNPASSPPFLKRSDRTLSG